MVPLSFLFVCLGNICRSPMAEAVFAAEAKARGLEVEVDSAGTGAYHQGDTPDERTVDVLERNGVPYACRARMIRAPDFARFDYIFAMDKNNLANLQRAQEKGSKAQVLLFSHFTGDQVNIKDPYYGGAAGFDRCYDQCIVYARAILDHVEGKPTAADE